MGAFDNTILTNYVFFTQLTLVSVLGSRRFFSYFSLTYRTLYYEFVEFLLFDFDLVALHLIYKIYSPFDWSDLGHSELYHVKYFFDVHFTVHITAFCYQASGVAHQVAILANIWQGIVPIVNILGHGSPVSFPTGELKLRQLVHENTVKFTFAMGNIAQMFSTVVPIAFDAPL